MFLLSSQCALVTGASRGIGLAIAMALAKQGAWVAGTATTQEGAGRIDQRLLELQLPGQGFVLDVCNSQSIEQLIQTLRELQKSPTILVNNAGITRDRLLLRLPESDWDAVIETNLTAMYRVTKHCLRPTMIKARFGRIINISSVVGVTGNLGQTPYAASKAGVIGFSKSLAHEVAPWGITVNVIAPGFIDTEMTQALPESNRKKLLERIPSQRLGTVRDVANACVFLASSESQYITGQTLHVNGGLLMS